MCTLKHVVCVQISAEFRAVVTTEKRLPIELLRFKTSILRVASSKPALADLLSSITDDFDEGSVAYMQLSETQTQIQKVIY
jgi:hypothetical protein